MINRDFDYLTTLLSDFFSQKEIRKRLSIIDEAGITGWEVWLQIEFASFIAQQNNIWSREEILEFDFRKRPEKYFFRPDFLLRKKGWILETYSALNSFA
ncbi:hypothetical protein FJU30_21275 [Affinibrenneria salicis]|uniref:Uncharacterized protein n=1 Tax=Affinibrenneria salicis TaxID=2590031 RepID=A0A5J5FU74_9GAMM|nr:hypothetical protein [Affinibrenneria salicis]KAA8996733.1 hypothetical protein FJU30_21275 [Affinibrenneria salicis]